MSEEPLVSAPIGEVVRAAVAGALARIVRHEPGVRRGDDPEDVHQARVGTRRLRSDLRTFRPLLDHHWAAALREEAGWYAGLLGEVRDVEVLIERLERQAGTLPDGDAAVVPVVARLSAERRAARSELLAGLDSPRYRSFLDRLTAAAEAPRFAGDDPAGGPGAPAGEALPALVRRPWDRLDRAVGKLPEVPTDDQLHRVRIRAKRARYAAEAAAGVIGKPAAAFAQRIAAVQTVLGDHQDACVTEAWLRRAAKRAGSTGEARVIDQLIGLQRAEAAAGRAAWPDTWARAAEPALRSWLTSRVASGP